jgi:hypothetical protein
MVMESPLRGHSVRLAAVRKDGELLARADRLAELADVGNISPLME